MISGKTQIAAAAAVLALSAASVSAAPAADVLEARGAGMSRVAKVGGDVVSDVAHRKTVGYVNDKIHEHYGSKPSVHPGMVEAARQHTKPHDSRIVAAATGHSSRRKRDLEDAIDELIARGAGMSRVAKVGGDVVSDVAHRKTVGYVNDKIHEHYGSKPSVHPGMVEAARQHTKPHDSRIVAAATGHTSRRKRDLEDELEELMARGAGMSRIAKAGGDVAADMAHRGVVNAANDKIKEHLGIDKTHVHPGLAEAARIANKPHDPKLVAAVTGHSRSHKKRELEDALEELMARGAGMSRVAKVGGDVLSDVAHRKTVGYVNDKIHEHYGTKPSVHPGLAEAARLATKPHDPKLVAAAIGHGHRKRELEDALEELMARGAGMSRVAKVGGDVLSDVAHRKTVGYVNDKIHEHYGTKPSVHPGLVEAARQHTKPHDPRLVAAATSHGRRKRSIEDELDELYAREFDEEFDELFARGAGMSRVAKVGGDVVSDVAHRKTVGYVNDKIHEHYGSKPSVHPGMVEAARQHTKPHDSRIVAAATGHTSRRKRDLAAALMDYVEARSFELDELE